MIAEEDLLIYMAGLTVLAAIVVLLLFVFTELRAFYGRYGTSIECSRTMPAKVAWFLQELPALSIPILLLVIDGDRAKTSNIANLVVFGMFVVHYVQRTLVYPFLIRGGKPTAISMFVSAFAFCCWNGYLQGQYHLKYANYSENHWASWLAIAGIVLFLVGMAINIHSDHVLRSLRKEGDTQYRIPEGGLFEYVSGANFFGEIVEWIGYAVYSQTLPAFAFALFTVCNIGPRAKHHHEYYLEKFEDYPRNRRALIPFIF